jgi:hypothetical protein
MPNNNSSLPIYTKEEIRQIADFILNYADLNRLNFTKDRPHISKAELIEAITELNQLNIEGKELLDQHYRLLNDLIIYSGGAIGLTGELVKNLKEKNYIKFEEIIKKNPQLSLVTNVDCVLAKNYNEKALNILLKHVLKYNLSQTIIGLGGIETIKYYLDFKGKEKEIATKIGINEAVIKLYHEDAINLITTDWHRQPELDETKLKAMVDLGLTYYQTTEEKFIFLKTLQNNLFNQLSSSQSLNHAGYSPDPIANKYAKILGQSLQTLNLDLNVLIKNANLNKLSQKELTSFIDLGLSASKDNEAKQKFLQDIKFNLSSIDTYPSFTTAQNVRDRYASYSSNETIGKFVKDVNALEFGIDLVYRDFCQKVADQAINNSTFKFQKIIDEILITDLIDTLQQDLKLKERYTEQALPSVAEDKIDNREQSLTIEGLSKKISEVINEVITNKEVIKNLDKTLKLENSLQKFEQKEKGEVSLKKRIIHKVKKFLFSSYSKEGFEKKVEILKTKLQPFKQQAITDTKEQLKRPLDITRKKSITNTPFR